MTGLDGRGLWLKSFLLKVLLPSARGIFWSCLSVSRQMNICLEQQHVLGPSRLLVGLHLYQYGCFLIGQCVVA